MIDGTSTRRGDEQLEFILYETANWTVNGPNGAVLCEAASLCSAVEQAAAHGALGRRVMALVRKRGPEIVVFPAQVQRLANQVSEPEDCLVARYAMNA